MRRLQLCSLLLLRLLLPSCSAGTYSSSLPMGKVIAQQY